MPEDRGSSKTFGEDAFRDDDFAQKQRRVAGGGLGGEGGVDAEVDGRGLVGVGRDAGADEEEPPVFAGALVQDDEGAGLAAGTADQAGDGAVLVGGAADERGEGDGFAGDSRGFLLREEFHQGRFFAAIGADGDGAVDEFGGGAVLSLPIAGKASSEVAAEEVGAGKHGPGGRGEGLVQSGGGPSREQGICDELGALVVLRAIAGMNGVVGPVELGGFSGGEEGALGIDEGDRGMSGYSGLDGIEDGFVFVAVFPWVLVGDGLGDAGPFQRSHADDGEDHAATGGAVAAHGLREAAHIVAMVEDAAVGRGDGVDGLRAARSGKHIGRDGAGEGSEVNVKGGPAGVAEGFGGFVLFRAGGGAAVPFRPAVEDDLAVHGVADGSGEEVIRTVLFVGRAVAIDEEDGVPARGQFGADGREGVGRGGIGTVGQQREEGEGGEEVAAMHRGRDGGVE